MNATQTSPDHDPFGEDISVPGIFRDGKYVVVRLGSKLPPICIKTNQPATGVLKRNLRWHPRVFYVSLLLPLVAASPFLFHRESVFMLTLLALGFIPYIALWLFLSQSTQLDIPLSDALRNKRAVFLGLNWMLFVISITLVVGGIVVVNIGRRNERMIGAIQLIAGSLLLFITFVNCFFIARMVVTTARMTKEYIWLKGADPYYRFRLPVMPRQSDGDQADDHESMKEQG